ncbi:hypothetical protein X801_02297 [Opisthorchis viverrini]|uniref:ADP/ATP translocase n=1 Tax=Opisthorchis viverrini TaxID=6198 RepID=A0A1S8X503_OPIVI|nr:hypothetical protein X801_02297 [Opisthorchis viverrini]
MSEGGKEIKGISFAGNFSLSEAAAVIAKTTAAAPIERVKLLIQNQSEMIKQGRLDRPYRGDKLKKIFNPRKDDPYWRSFYKNVFSGGVAGAMSRVFVYSLGYALTRLANDAKSVKKGYVALEEFILIS